jgi:hypothetical protein
MKKNLDDLPYDIIFEIIRYLGLDDFVNLTKVNPVLLEDDLAAKFIAMVNICNSTLILWCLLY